MWWRQLVVIPPSEAPMEKGHRAPSGYLRGATRRGYQNQQELSSQEGYLPTVRRNETTDHASANNLLLIL
jgi:hypothetical protein